MKKLTSSIVIERLEILNKNYTLIKGSCYDNFKWLVATWDGSWNIPKSEFNTLSEVMEWIDEQENYMEMEKFNNPEITYLMNPLTGSVDTRENWVADMENWSNDPMEQQRQFDTLIEVKQINDEWVEI